MKIKREYSGFAIALAWPKTYCKQPGSWYDPVTRWLSISKNNYYRAGHAALVLVDVKRAECHYFDFGRYHAPYKQGRVRSAETDHDLIMTTRPLFSNDGDLILNYNKILEELQYRTACHGEGALHASYCAIDFNSALKKVKLMKSNSPMPYGPFIKAGSNCSRFVNTALLAGKPGWKYRLRLKYFIPFTPTPLNNVHSLSYRTIVPVIRKTEAFCPVRPLTKDEVHSTLPQPVRHSDIPEKAQWLSGEGAGSWFYFAFDKEVLKVTRYAPDGTLECSGYFKSSSEDIKYSDESLSIDHPSNCKEVNLNYKGRSLKFHRIDDHRNFEFKSSSRQKKYSIKMA